MPRRCLVAVFALSATLAAGRADAVTVRDVIELSKAGLSDSVLLALIDVDRSMFAIDTATLKQLKSAGVSDAVIVAMIHSGRDPRPPETFEPVAQEPAPVPEAPPPPIDTAQEAAPPPAPYPVPIPVAVYVAVPVAQARGDVGHAVKHTVSVEARPNCQSAQIPAWGFGGTIRQLPPVCR